MSTAARMPLVCLILKLLIFQTDVRYLRILSFLVEISVYITDFPTGLFYAFLCAQHFLLNVQISLAHLLLPLRYVLGWVSEVVILVVQNIPFFLSHVDWRGTPLFLRESLIQVITAKVLGFLMLFWRFRMMVLHSRFEIGDIVEWIIYKVIDLVFDLTGCAFLLIIIEVIIFENAVSFQYYFINFRMHHLFCLFQTFKNWFWRVSEVMDYHVHE